jgi:hypothetical protein
VKAVREDDYGLGRNVDRLRPHSHVYAGELDGALLGFRRGCSEHHDDDEDSSDPCTVSF